MAINGRMTPAELEPIPGGQLAIPAARAWNAPGGPAEAGLRPSAFENSYRDLATQWDYWNLYQEHKGNLAAYPGTSNHGLGVAIDCANAWEQQWIYDHGAKFGWRKTEAFSEPWHFNFVGGVGPFPAPFETLEEGDKGKRVLHYTKRLSYIRSESHPKGYLGRWYRKYKEPVRIAVRAFQHDFKLSVDGKIGKETAAKIETVFMAEWKRRHPKKK